jgi:hypothetical protein
MSANISSGNIGMDARNDIQWRKDWIARLTECEVFINKMINTGDIPYSLQYSTNIVKGAINYQTETANLIIQICLHGNEVWFSSLQKAVQAVYTGLNATGRKNDWGLLNWPQQGVSNTNPFASVKQYDFSIVFELLNDKNKVIGKQALSLKPAFQFLRPGIVDNNNYILPEDFSRNPEKYINMIMIDYIENFYRTMTFNAVKVDDISDSLTIRIVSVNGNAPQNTPIQITAVSNPNWNPQLFFYHLRRAGRSIEGFELNSSVLSVLQQKQYLDFVFPDNVWGEQITNIVTHIDEWAFENKGLTTITIPDGIISINRWAFSKNNLIKISIGTNVEIHKDAFSLGVFGSESFRDFYYTNGRKAGTYTLNSNTKRWSFSN